MIWQRPVSLCWPTSSWPRRPFPPAPMSCCAPAPTTSCAPATQTVCVTEWVKENYTTTRTVNRTECVQEAYTAYRTECVPETRTRVCTVNRMVPEYRDEVRTVCVSVPTVETPPS